MCVYKLNCANLQNEKLANNLVAVNKQNIIVILIVHAKVSKKVCLQFRASYRDSLNKLYATVFQQSVRNHTESDEKSMLNLIISIAIFKHDTNVKSV